jgi:hypothetical protein
MAVPRGSPGLGLVSGSPRFKYAVNYFGVDGVGTAMPGIGSFNAFTPAITFGAAVSVPPNGAASTSVTVNSAELVNTPALGVMVLAPDNVSGAAQAALVTAP